MKLKKFISSILIFVLVFSMSSLTTYAKSTSINAPYGGVWTFTSLDSSEYSKVSLTKGKPTLRVDKIIYLTPKQVSQLSGNLLNESQRKNIIGQIKAAVSAGSTELAKSLILKLLGQEVAKAINPYIGVAGWIYTIGSFLDTLSDNYYYSSVASAAKQNKGLIFKYHTSQDRAGNYSYSGFVFFKWDGSSILGSYPNVKTPYAHNGKFTSGNNTVTSSGSSYPGTLIKEGSKGSNVTKIQNQLNKLGFNCGTADGIFGSSTKNAVIKFQKSKNLTADGIVGKTTWDKLFSSSSSSNSGYSRILKVTNPLMYGSDIKKVQTKLNQLGYNAGTVDGYYGTGTKNAVIRFQKAKKITADGIVGSATWNKLF